MATKQQQKMVDIRLDSPRTPENTQLMPQYQMSPLAPLSGEGQAAQQNRSWPSNKPDEGGKPYVRFYAIGPQTKNIRCPLCKERSDTEEATPSNFFETLNCLLSCFSCCFPIFTLSCLYTMCFKDCFKNERMFCNKCGGHLGFYARPH